MTTQAESTIERAQAKAAENIATAPKTVTITIEEHELFKHDSALLAALMAYGVDSWEGWDLAISSL